MPPPHLRLTGGEGRPPVYDRAKDFLGSWGNDRAWLEWRVPVAQPGEYDVILTLGSTLANNEFTLHLGDETLRGTVPNTGGWETFHALKLGPVKLPAGEITIALKPAKVSGALMNLRALTLVPNAGKR